MGLGLGLPLQSNSKLSEGSGGTGSDSVSALLNSDSNAITGAEGKVAMTDENQDDGEKEKLNATAAVDEKRSSSVGVAEPAQAGDKVDEGVLELSSGKEVD